MRKPNVQEGLNALYLRKSRADLEKERRGEYETLAKHERQLTAYADSLGLPIDMTYRELTSAESVSERFEFQRLMDEVSQRKYTRVIVHAIDRLGRGDVMEYGWILSTFKWTRTLIVTPGKTYDPNDPSDFMALQMQMIVASGELEAYKRRMKESREQSVRDGKYIGQREPFGYDKCKIDGKHTLRKNDDAPLVVEMFSMVASGRTPSSIATEFNTVRHIPSPSGRTWMPLAVKRIIQNPLYKGYVRWNYRAAVVESRDGLEYKISRRKNPNCMVEKGLHEPIVTDDLWQRANDALIPGTREHATKPLKNPLAALLVCAKCGGTIKRSIVRSRGKDYPRYIHKQYTNCRQKSADMQMVVDMVADSLAQIADDIEIAFKTGEDKSSKIMQEKDRLEKDIAAAQRRIDKLVELHFEDAISVAEFRDRRAPVDAQMELMQKRLAELCAMRIADPREVVTTLREAIASLKDPSVSAAEQNRALRRIVDRIEYSNDAPSEIGMHDIHLNIFLRS